MPNYCLHMSDYYAAKHYRAVLLDQFAIPFKVARNFYLLLAYGMEDQL